MIARRFASVVAACGMLAAAIPAAQARCTASADESAFDVSALKSELSVLAVACGDDTEYNAFIEHSRGELVRQDAVVNAWFKKNYGRAAQAKYDSYITLQANEQSVSGQHEGSDFCPRMKPVFTEVMAVPLVSLPQYAAAKNMMPVDVACTSISENAPAARAGRTAAPHRASTKK